MVRFDLNNSTSLWGTFVIGLILVYLIWKSLDFKQFRKKSHDNVIDFWDLPSPKGYPLVGHLPFLGKLPHETLTKWSKEFGSLYRIKMGFKDVLIVSGLKTIRTALLKNAVAFAGRPPFETLKFVKYSLAFSDYSSSWANEKSKSVAAVNLYTTGKDPSKRSLMEENSFKHANDLVKDMLKARDQNNFVDPSQHIVTHVTNSTCNIAFGHEFDIDDPVFQKFLLLHKNYDKVLGVSRAANFWPLIKYFPIVSRSFEHFKRYQDHITSIVSSFAESHIETFDEANIRDIFDSLYYELFNTQRTQKDRANLEKPFGFNNAINQQAITKKNKIKLNAIVASIVKASFDTLSAMIYWSLLYFAVYPEIQEKVFEEIETNIGKDELPSFRLHSKKCHYTMAYIYELIRHVAPLPILLPHSTTQETQLENCVLPPGLTVYFNIHQINYDPNIWKNPQEFSPERFLDQDTQIFQQNRAANILGWGMGKRMCPGRDLSKHEMFTFICTIVRRLKIKPSKPGIEPTLPWPMELGISLMPQSYQIDVTER